MSPKSSMKNLTREAQEIERTLEAAAQAPKTAREHRQAHLARILGDASLAPHDYLLRWNVHRGAE